MIDAALLSRWVADIRRIYAQDPAGADQALAAYLKGVLGGYPAGEGRAAVQQIISRLAPPAHPPASGGDISRLAPPVPVPASGEDQQVVARVFSLLLGRKITPDELASGEVIERLAKSLNTIFDSLNRLVGVINSTLSGGADSGEQTIRQFIGVQLEGADQTQPMEAYLGRINQAFLVTQEAFKRAARTQVGRILKSFENDGLERSGVLKIGPLRKAENFDVLKEKIERIKRWFESDRFMEDYLREFEKNCQSLMQ